MNLPLARVLPLLLAPLLVHAEDAKPSEKQPGLNTEQLLERLSSPDKAPRASAMRTLGQRKTKEAIAPISACLADPDEQIRVAAIEALADIGAPEAIPSVLGCLGDPSAGVVLAAVRAAGRFPPKDAVPALLNVLDHPQPGVRLHAFEALRGLTRLDFGYVPEARPEERSKSIAAWRAWWAQSAAETPFDWWRAQLGSDLSSHRIACARALGESGDDRAIPDLLPLLDDPETPVRFEASRALIGITGFDLGFDAYGTDVERKAGSDRWKGWWVQHGDKPRKEWLQAGLKDGTPKNRAAAIRGLEKLGMPDGVPWLIDSLEDREEGVRAEASRALIAITGRDEGFNGAAPETERMVAVARWRKWWKENQARPPIVWWEVTLCSNDTPANKASAARRLSQTKEWEAVRYLVMGLDDETEGVRGAVIEGLKKLTGETLDFAPEAEPSERAAAVKRWERWLTEHKDAWQPPK